MNEMVPVRDTGADDQRLAVLAVEIETIQSGMFFEIGKRLAEARDIHKYNGYPGGFEGWCRDRLTISFRVAQRLVQVVDNVGQKNAGLGVLSLDALVEVSRAEPDVQSIIAERVEAGEIFTAEQVKAARREAEEAAAEVTREKIIANERRIAEAAERIAELEAGDDEAVREITKLKKRIAGFEKMVDDAKRDLPTVEEAVERSKETGGGVLAQDGKWHREPSPQEQQQEAKTFAAFHSTIARWHEHPVPAAIIAKHCPPSVVLTLVTAIDAVIANLNAIAKEISRDRPEQ